MEKEGGEAGWLRAGERAGRQRLYVRLEARVRGTMVHPLGSATKRKRFKNGIVKKGNQQNNLLDKGRRDGGRRKLKWPAEHGNRKQVGKVGGGALTKH